MSDLFLNLFNRAMAAGWLVLAVLVLRLVLKKAPKWVCCLLWALVAVRLVCPFTPESALSLVPSAQVLASETLYDPTPELHTGIEFVNSAVNRSFTPAMTTEGLTSVNPLQIWTWLAGWVWAVGAAAMAVYALVSWLRLKKQVAASVEENGVWRCDGIGSPFILGAFRPRIYVPSDLAGADLDHVLAHERAHLQRKDHWWKPLAYFLLAVFWFQPLLWAAYVLLCRDIELACDEKVVRTLDVGGKKAYSQALVTCAVSRRTIAACPVAFGEVGVKQRVKSVLHYKKPAFWVMAAALVLCVIVAVCFLTDPVEPPFGTAYAVETVVYADLAFSSGPEHFAADVYTVTENGVLLGDGEELGKAKKIRLTPENFDQLVVSAVEWTEAAWKGGYNMTLLRDQNETAWSVQTQDDVFYYLLRQSNGDIYLTYGYDRENDGEDFVRFVFRLGQWHGDENEYDPYGWRDGVDVAVTEAADSLADGSAYYTTACVFMNPLSSTLSGADSGYYYYIDGKDFVLGRRRTMTELRIPGVIWHWQAFPWTEEEWAAKFWLEPVDLSGYTEILYQPLDESDCLLSVDGRLWLVEDHGNSKTGIWSIYALERAENLEAAQWAYMEGTGQPLTITFDVEFDEVQLSCTGGALHGAYENVNDDVLHYYGDQILYWTAATDSGAHEETARQAEIRFTAYRDGKVRFQGTVAVELDEENAPVITQCDVSGTEQPRWRREKDGRLVFSPGE